MKIVLVLGSAPDAVRARDMPRDPFAHVVAINNAWRVWPEWDILIHPDDFPARNHPPTLRAQQRIVTSDAYVPLQNELGGFVYAGGTMAFTAGYWALQALRPDVLAFLGCDMVYGGGQTHFYGSGAADPLRADVSLRNLEAKSARLMLLAAERGCACVNLSDQASSRLLFPRAGLEDLARAQPRRGAVAGPLAREAALGYMAPSGRYWEVEDRFDPAEIDALDQMWLDAVP